MKTKDCNFLHCFFTTISFNFLLIFSNDWTNFEVIDNKKSTTAMYSLKRNASRN